MIRPKLIKSVSVGLAIATTMACMSGCGAKKVKPDKTPVEQNITVEDDSSSNEEDNISTEGVSDADAPFVEEVKDRDAKEVADDDITIIIEEDFSSEEISEDDVLVDEDTVAEKEPFEKLSLKKAKALPLEERIDYIYRYWEQAGYTYVNDFLNDSEICRVFETLPIEYIDSMYTELEEKLGYRPKTPEEIAFEEEMEREAIRQAEELKKSFETKVYHGYNPDVDSSNDPFEHDPTYNESTLY